ncbi:MAG: hypothetical protein CME19_11960 [Gemmatimonadetes bacterium]|nr:hypothetical protein [Gemmatimonadota bacterium]
MGRADGGSRCEGRAHAGIGLSFPGWSLGTRRFCECFREAKEVAEADDAVAVQVVARRCFTIDRQEVWAIIDGGLPVVVEARIDRSKGADRLRLARCREPLDQGGRGETEGLEREGDWIWIRGHANLAPIGQYDHDNLVLDLYTIGWNAFRALAASSRASRGWNLRRIRIVVEHPVHRHLVGRQRSEETREIRVVREQSLAVPEWRHNSRIDVFGHRIRVERDRPDPLGIGCHVVVERLFSDPL